jgi:2-polyprenyl-6-methoxyphenol hydroxylase-like FAD-dependent oxidoreductase
VSSSPQPNGRTLGQSNTEAILRSHLSGLGVTVELGTELVDFTQDAHKVTANLLKRDKGGSSQNETLEVDWMIGADGARGYFSPLFIS